MLHFLITIVRSLNPKRSIALIMFHLALYLCNSYDIYIVIADINWLLCTVNSNVATIYFIIVFLTQVHTKVAVMCGTACYGDYVINVSALGKDETNSDVQR